MTEHYLTGERPQIGDFVLGKPQDMLSDFACIVAAHHEGLLSLLLIGPLSGEVIRFYGTCDKFELLHRNGSVKWN